MTLDGRTRLFVVLSAIFVICLVVGDIVGGKVVQASVLGYAVTITVGMIPFPITFLLTDLLHEFYGKGAARFVTWVGFGVAVLAYAVLALAAAVPIASFTREPGWQGVTDESFRNVFSTSQRMLVASLVAYLIAQLVDIAVFHALKRRTGQRLLWLRATGSTLLSQMVDTLAVSMVAWWGLLPWPTLANLLLTSYSVKLLVAIGLTPLIYAGHAVVERWFGLEPVRLDAEGAPVSEPLARGT